jgi:glycosyltransferase involved in cell wall biosynthesis
MPPARSPEVSVVVTHRATSGPADALVDYLLPRRRRLVVVEHGFGSAASSGTSVRMWQDGRLVRQRSVPWSSRAPGPLTWIKDFAVTLLVGLWLRERADSYIGIDSLNASAGLVLRTLRRARRVVFWTIDYAPNRFGNSVLNRIYFALDRLCVTCCDVTWNLSPRMEEARARRGVHGLQRVVPMGGNVSRLTAPVDAQIVHMGSLLAKQGVQVVIEALPQIRAAVPRATLLIIGDGPYRRELERLARSAGVADAVTFAGYVDDHAEVERMLGESAVAIATYDPAQADFTYYADPGKIKAYLAAGVPIVLTDVPWSAQWVAEHGAGLVVEYRPDDVARGVLALIGNADARSAAAELGRRDCDWTRIFDRAFEGQARTQTKANA